MLKGFLVVLLSFPVFAFATQIKELDNKAYWICEHRKEARTIRVQVGKDGLCVTLYSKFGKEKSVGSGRNLPSCIRFMNNVKSNLEKSGFKCRDISGAKITASLDEK